MKIVDLTCKKCMGVMQVNEDDEKIVCPFCGTTNWIVENDEIRRDKAKYKYLNEKEKLKADAAHKRDAELYKFLKFKYLFIAAGVIAAIVFLIIGINHASEHAHIAPPASASKLIGRKYDDVKTQFIDAGFLNVETKAIADLQNGFLYDAKQDDGKVISVSIGGQEKFVVDEGFIFHHTDTFDKNDQVRITYRTIPEPTRTPEEIAADNSVNADWTDAPVILSANEIGKDQFTVIWEGKAPVYIVRVDGVEKTAVADNKATFKLDNGQHTVQIIPVNRETRRDDIKNITGPITIKTPINFSLDMYHMQKDHLVAGLFSEEIRIDYVSEKIYDMAPMNLKAYLDLRNAVHLGFTDPSEADGYLVTYKTGNEEHSIVYNKADEAAAKWITANGDSTEVILDTDYLKAKNWPGIQEDKDYSFSVVLYKRPMDYVAQNRSHSVMLASRNANVNLKTTPVWKDAPVITLGEQTADGEITVQWSHPAVELGCQYAVSLRNKAVFITTGESELIKVNGAEAKIKDLKNGNYTLVVTPDNNGERGTSSTEFTVTVNNNWSQAPDVTVSQVDQKTAKVEITHIFGIDTYNIKVLCGDNGNLLRFVDLDYSLYGEYTVDAASPVTEYTFKYDKELSPTEELKVKFEVYGIHRTEDGTTQHSATKTVQITLKP